MQCIKCGREGNDELFKNFYGRESKYCQYCRDSARKSMQRIKTKEQRTEDHRKWRKGNTEYKRYMYEYNLKKQTGLTLAEYEEISNRQEGKCLICQEIPPKNRFGRLHVDHCHKSKQVRGLLCSSCNTALGLFKDREDLMERAVEYLKRGGQLTVEGKVQR